MSRISALPVDAKGEEMATERKKQQDRERMRRKREEQENAISKLKAALTEAIKGLEMVHNGLMDPTRPRQSVGEVCNHFLSKSKATRAEMMRE